MDTKSKEINVLESDSSESDDEMEKLKSALDPTFQLLPKVSKSNGRSSTGHDVDVGEKKKSKRTLRSTDWDSGHFVHPLRLEASTQEFVSRQLFQAMDRHIKFTKAMPPTSQATKDHGILLFSSSTTRLKGKHLNKNHKRSGHPVLNKKPKICDSDSESETDMKLKSVAVDIDWIKNPKTV